MMIIAENIVVTLSYQVRENNAVGLVVETMDVTYPFQFMFGTGALLPAFEKHITGLREGDAFSFTLTPDEAYGPVHTDNILDVPARIFQEGEVVQDDLLKEGQFVTLSDDLGESHNGKILSWNNELVTIDFNHIMAGKTLYFHGVVLHLRPASAEEVRRNHFIAHDGLRNQE
ncbi:MAG: FKBP-type peptidyl-prolyl cis-trans isomerase [Saprospiraceae bacterium]|nr:FKBP-type peptidyl-prolyl cis-trans isomerase [Saprospiraceae bacterium]